MGAMAGATTIMATLAAGQNTTGGTTAPPGSAPVPTEGVTAGQNYQQWLGEHFGVALLAVIGLLVMILVIYFLTNRRGRQIVEDMYSETEHVESSRFEQVLAETQGLYLRIQGGESKGYYRKIEQLTRIFMERTGYVGARQMSDEEIQGVLTSGAIPQKQATVLGSIFERCKQGSEHETRKLDFTAGELLKDLRNLVKQVEEMPSEKSS
jgi:uncharacterized membrane protein